MPIRQSVLALALLVTGAPIASAGDDDGPPEPDARVMEFQLRDRDVVEAAAKHRTKIQQVPAIVTVITAQEIRDGGFRTISDVLSVVPGFDSDRWEYNGWYKNDLTRGMPRTALVLLDGVNIVEPTRNLAVLDRRIPIESVKRVEVTSGPGSVLWGGNALLGVVNILTWDGASNPGFHARVGGGHGPGEPGAVHAHLSYGGRFQRDVVKLWVGATYHTALAPTLTVDLPKVFGPLPAPAADGPAILGTREATSGGEGRSHTFNVNGKLEMGPVTLGLSTGFVRDVRGLGVGGALLATNHGAGETGNTDLASIGTEQMHLLYLRYASRFLGQTVGVAAQAHVVNWKQSQDPFGIFPRSDLLPAGGKTILESDGVVRAGGSVDVDVVLPWQNHLLLGGEVFADLSGVLHLTSFDPRAGAETKSGGCLPPFQFHPERDALRPCSLREAALGETRRIIGGLYLVNEWRLSNRFALSGGVRAQLSSTYKATLLASAGLVAGLTDAIFLKVNFGQGFRPPDLLSTSPTRGIASAVAFQGNPDLQVERSHSVEGELNARLLENAGPVKQWSLRADYSFTRLAGLIGFPGGHYDNSGDRDLHTVELMTKLVFKGGHELWLAYTFLDVIDAELGRLGNIPNHVLSAGGKASFFDGRFLVSAVVTVRGAMRDVNRGLPASAALPVLGLKLPDGLAWSEVTNVEVTSVPTTTQLRIGLEGRGLWNHLDVSAWVYNVLDQRPRDPDWFGDGRIMLRSQPKPGLSFAFEVGTRW